MSIGIDRQVIDNINYELAIKRIKNDLQSDFIYAPHFNIIFHKAPDKLCEELSKKLRNGTFEPKLPITIEVPKESGFTRPGSILWPYERLAYQVFVDAIAPIAERSIDRKQVFSNILFRRDPKGFMFKSAGISYDRFKKKKLKYCQSRQHSYVVRADITSYFERLYQHVLINLLDSSGCDTNIVNFLEKLLSSFTQKDSHGIIQGVSPSDFLGNFYLCSLDAKHKINNIRLLRYVDDLYTFFKSHRDALRHKIQLNAWLRPDGLNLNEAKTKIFKTEDLIYEETKIDTMFEQAREEVSDNLDREDFYLSTMPWDDDLIIHEVLHDEEEIELEATKQLFSLADIPKETRNKINKFCLPIFAAAKCGEAVPYVLENFVSLPHMAQVFAKYAQPFIKEEIHISREIEKIFLQKDLIYEYQLLWLLAMLMSAKKLRISTVNKIIKLLNNNSISNVVKAVGVILAGKFGTAPQRRIIKTCYQGESPYVQAAILYAAKYFPGNERRTCFRAWSGHDEINSIIALATTRAESET